MRHGQSTANALGVWQGQLDYPLSELGRDQARLTGRVLRGVPISAVYASPLSRAFETAEILAREAGYAAEPVVPVVPVVPVEGLQERYGGTLEGKTWAEQETENPEFARKFLSIPEEERWTMVGAETDEEVLARFSRAFDGILARHGGEEGSDERKERLVVVSHGGAMRAYLRDTFGGHVLASEERAPNASITRLLFAGDAPPRLLELASTTHLLRPPGVV